MESETAFTPLELASAFIHKPILLNADNMYKTMPQVNR